MYLKMVDIMANGLRKSPPLDYQVVEYLKGDRNGSAYIPLNYYPNNKTGIYGVGYFDSISSVIESCCGVWWPTFSSSGYNVGYNSTYLGGFLPPSFAPDTNNRSVLRAGVKFTRRLNIDGQTSISFEDGVGNAHIMSVSFNSTSKGTFTSPYPVVAFAGVSPNGISEFSSERLYVLRIYEDGVLVHDYIPCYRISDSKVGLYDIVAGVFHEAIGNITYG